jgi:rRNA-processing protein FCF1
MNEFEQVPETYEAENEDFNELYVLAWALIIQALMRLIRLPLNPTSTELLQLERKVNSEVREIFVDLERKSIPMATEKVREAYLEGLAYSRTALSQEDKSIQFKDDTDIGTDTDTEINADTVELNDTHKQRLNKMIQQTQDDLLKATGNTQNNIKLLVRKVVSREISGAGRGGKIGKQSHMAKRIEQQLRKQFLENGIKDSDVAIIDRANRHWKLRTYSNMVTRTKMNMAYIDAIREDALQNGMDLAIISTKPDTHDECLNYEGMIISLNGLTSGYLTYDEIKKSKKCFHPNCGHYVRPIGGIEWVPPNLLQKHKRQMAKYRAK